MPSRILYIDDDREICRFASFLLKDDELISVHSKAEALSILSAETFDLIVLDYTLPDGLGSEICQYIRWLDKDVPILFCTVSGELRRKDLHSLGAQGLLIKGLDFADNFASTVRRLLSTAKKQSNTKVQDNEQSQPVANWIHQ